MTRKHNIFYPNYPVRICRTIQYCNICRRDITCGEEYYDGGYNRRAHKKCVDEKFKGTVDKNNRGYS